jgi:hypothetical protein
MGATDDELSQFGTMLQQDPQGFLRTIRGKVEQKKLEFRHVGEGYDIAADPSTGRVVQEYRGPLTVGKTERLLMPDAAPQMGAEAPAPVPAAPVAPIASQGSTGGFDAFLGSLRNAESSGRAGVAGPPTRSGTAHGTMQVLDSTGQAMAQRLGVAWQPELMRGASPEAVAYQDKIGRAYAEEAWQAAGGDPRIAAMYYHGGPDRRQWGRRTRAHGDKVMAGLGAVSGGAGQERMAGGGADPVMPGYRQVLGPEPDEQVRPATPQEKASIGLRPEEAAQRFPSGEIKPLSQRDAGKTFDQEHKLRTQFGSAGEVKDLASVQSHVSTIGRIAGKAANGEKVSAADDIALIFAFMKMLDPGSVVREGEFANAQNTASIPDRIRNSYNKALRGTRLSTKQRDEFFRTASLAMDSYVDNYNRRAGQYRGYAESYGLNADRVAKPRQSSRRTRSGGGPVTIDINGNPVR